MNIGMIILCRYDSSRLHGKILRPINGKPILAYIYERLRMVSDVAHVVVATSDEPSDDLIVQYCQDQGIPFYRGPKNNVALRFLECAEHFDFDFCTRINGDNLFTDPETLNEMLEIAKSDRYDFISNVVGRTFPRGMSIEIVRVDFYRSALRQFDNLEYFEHVTLYFYHHENYGRQYHFKNQVCPKAGNLQFAVDTQSDFDLVEKIVSRMKDVHTQYSFSEIYSLFKEVSEYD